MRRRALAASLPALLLVLTAAWAFADHGGGARFVPYQGRLELDGTLVDGPVNMTFSFYASEQAGSALDSVTRSVDVQGGAFALDIGPVADSVFDAPALFLGVAVEGQELGARQRLRGAAYAVRGQVGQPFRASSLAVDGNAEIQEARIGDVGHGTAWPGIANRSAAGSTSYALVQNAAGTSTLVNAAPGGQVEFRIGNTKRASVSGDGLVLGSGTALKGLTVTTHQAIVSLPGGVGIWEQTTSVGLTPVGASLCALSRSALGHSTAPFTTAEYVAFGEDCRIVQDGDAWVLQAQASRAYHGHPLSLTCEATCLRWDQ